jgi:hypothetical protein
MDDKLPNRRPGQANSCERAPGPITTVVAIKQGGQKQVTLEAPIFERKDTPG